MYLNLDCIRGGTKEPTREQQQPIQQQQRNQTPTQQQPANQTPTQQQGSQPSTNVISNNGKGMRLGILVPQSQGLNENQGYLPALIQGVLVSDISN